MCGPFRCLILIIGADLVLLSRFSRFFFLSRKPKAELLAIPKAKKAAKSGGRCVYVERACLNFWYFMSSSDLEWVLISISISILIPSRSLDITSAALALGVGTADLSVHPTTPP